MEYHYPTMAQDGCRLLVAYSVLHRARLQSGGIKLAHINMQGVRCAVWRASAGAERLNPSLSMPPAFPSSCMAR